MRDNAMSLLSKTVDFRPADDRLHDVPAVTADLFAELLASCRRVAATKHTKQAMMLERLIDAGAWTSAALALIEIELPQWQLRRIVYDNGAWHCSLSSNRELPEWLDQSIETHHADLPLAILSAFVEARNIGAAKGNTSVPSVARPANGFYEPVCCDNFA